MQEISMSGETCLQLIHDAGVIAILRAKSPDHLLQAAKAIHQGGITAIEVTLNTPGALQVIEQATAHFGEEVAFGAGTVLNAEDAQAAIQAGAQFIVTPTLKAEVIKVCRHHKTPVLPGAYTPTEILTAWELGADMVKVFPASVGGPAFIKAVRAPLPQIELIPVGGVTLKNVTDYIDAGAVAVGVGSELLDPRFLQTQDWYQVKERAQQFVAAVIRARGSA
ncbi:MAG: bifunctional 4-hydroxy-2-oxoglutarate aldolase/2-dehydro-3-deoxy-phosphogluconate aldolase [Chloroflexota bacterium]